MRWRPKADSQVPLGSLRRRVVDASVKSSTVSEGCPRTRAGRKRVPLPKRIHLKAAVESAGHSITRALPTIGTGPGSSRRRTGAKASPVLVRKETAR